MDEMLRTSTCNLKIFIVTSSLTGLLTATVASRIHRAAQPALLYLVPFTLLPLLTMAYLKVRGEGTWAARGQLAAGAVSLHWAAALRGDGSPGPAHSDHCCVGSVFISED